jgi:hypothetical protein
MLDSFSALVGGSHIRISFIEMAGSRSRERRIRTRAAQFLMRRPYHGRTSSAKQESQVARP